MLAAKPVFDKGNGCHENGILSKGEKEIVVGKAINSVLCRIMVCDWALLVMDGV